MVHGKYGEYKVLVDGEQVFNGGAKVVLGVFPSVETVEELVRNRINKA